MGTWGPNSFENDDSLDWVDILKTEGIKAIDDALNSIVLAEDSEYLEAPECGIAIALVKWLLLQYQWTIQNYQRPLRNVLRRIHIFLQ